MYKFYFADNIVIIINTYWTPTTRPLYTKHVDTWSQFFLIITVRLLLLQTHFLEEETEG